MNCSRTLVRLFADDAILYRPISCEFDSESLQTQLCRVADWAKARQLQFNVSKCTSTSMLPLKLQNSYRLESTSLKNSVLFIWVCMYVIYCLLRTMFLRLLEKQMPLGEVNGILQCVSTSYGVLLRFGLPI